MAKRIRTKKASPRKLQRAGKAMDKAYTAFRNAQYAFAKLVYDAGNKKWDAFNVALKQAYSEWHASGGWIGFSNDTIKTFFEHLAKSTQN